MYPLLNRIENPEDVKKLTVRELEQLASELRHFIIDTVSQNGGHLAPNLGTVELTLALYSVFSFPTDKLVWDVGHQAYSHKILTGRRDAFSTLRKKGGITGFPNRFESVYDAFGVGHASTSISAALGMALARDAKGEKNQVIAVIGDGALTGGESFEALNNAGDLGTKLIVILNDNEMSIGANVGAMSEYLSRIRIAPQYARAKRDMGSLLMSIPHIGDKVYKTASHLKDGVRSVLVPGSLFEEMGFHYIGPLDGHNIALMEEVFKSAKEMEGPVLIHIHTVKGKGYQPAEQAPEKFHGVGCFDPSTGKSAKKAGCAPSYTSVFSQALIELAKDRPDILAITAAMPSGTGLKAFGKAYPKRFFDVGIAEEHAMTLAAGMAAGGMHPVIALYSTFAQRAYDQLIHDVCLQNLPVTLCLDRAGLVGEDGPTNGERLVGSRALLQQHLLDALLVEHHRVAPEQKRQLGGDLVQMRQPLGHELRGRREADQGEDHGQHPPGAVRARHGWRNRVRGGTARVSRGGGGCGSGRRRPADAQRAAGDERGRRGAARPPGQRGRAATRTP